MNLLKEMYDQPGLDNYDRAIDMINTAVEKHENNFDKIADVDSLIEYLKGVHHDFNEQLEQTVRDIIADETNNETNDEEDLYQHRDNYNKGLTPEEDEEFRGGGKYNRDTAPDFRGSGKQPTYFSNNENKRYQGKLKSAARIINKPKPEEEEFDGWTRGLEDEILTPTGTQRLQKMTRNRNIKTRNKHQHRSHRRSLSKTGRAHRRGPGLEQEELNDFLTPAGRKRFTNTDWDEEVSKFRKRRPKDDYGRASKRVMRRKRTTHSSNPFSVSFEQEETFPERVRRYQDETDKLIADNRKRKMARKYGISGPSSRKRRRIGRGTGRPLGSFGLKFESFKQFNEMYRDSQHGLTIDLSGPEGNAFYLIGQAKKLAKELGKDGKAIAEEMMSSDYKNVLSVFKREFGSIVTLINET